MSPQILTYKFKWKSKNRTATLWTSVDVQNNFFKKKEQFVPLFLSIVVTDDLKESQIYPWPTCDKIQQMTAFFKSQTQDYWELK